MKEAYIYYHHNGLCSYRDDETVIFFDSISEAKDFVLKSVSKKTHRISIIVEAPPVGVGMVMVDEPFVSERAGRDRG